jgi:hypothetical protein
MTNLLDRLQSDILGAAPLSDLLRAAMVLAFRLKNQELKDWVDRELNGYPDGSTVPDYRVLPTAAFGTFTNGFQAIQNVAIPLNVFPDDTREQFRFLVMGQGIRELESMLEACVRSDEGTLHSRFPGITTHYLANRVFEGMVCLSAWRTISQAGLAGILDTIRTRLLQLTLELAERYPEAAHFDFTAAAKNPSSAQVGQVVQYTFHGDHTTFNPGSNTTYHTEALTMNEVTIGSVQNSAVNILSDLTHVTQQIGALAGADQSTKDDLIRLVTELQEALKQTPPTHTEEGERLAKRVEAAVGEVSKPKPDAEVVEFSLESMKKAATNLAAVVPMVLPIAMQIVEHIRALPH